MLAVYGWRAWSQAKRARVPQLAAQVATNEVQHTVSAEAAIAADDTKATPMAGPLDSLPPELQTRIAALKETIASVAGALKSSETETELAIRKAPAGLADLQEVPAAAAAAAAAPNPKADARAAARRQRTQQALEASSASATGKVAQLFDR
ncbi:hypothetical protein JKP88DRAFT_254243 [Tribonema minus]|uniref:Uncharacterized protein n=1 Tax=Tribonema minus TaxID=303371 RepID=A0A835Z5W7_9STRA|nr:hypothetical protein JKP88DRAFT_254243 [Tribonema minus]